MQINAGLKEVVATQLAARGAAGRPTPAITVKVSGIFDLQFRGTVEGHSFISDEPKHGGGQDTGPAPLRYFLAGALMCHQVWCVKRAALAGVSLTRLDSEITGYLHRLDNGDGHSFGRIGISVAADSDADDARLVEVVRTAARNCPAINTLAFGSTIEFAVSHNGHQLPAFGLGAAPARTPA